MTALVEKDAVLVGQAELPRPIVEAVAGDTMLAGTREEGIGAIAATPRETDFLP